ncbi:BREX-1 system adenine-specific DNA-methyltransferase PglX [Arthrobacter sp. TWP1-1]|uniref:BREX-1 system adenine-specific DNA-methyltransferase PglX n=1 Tax=Arthrobacter sp. TWP1-1 TaxID=2804568 RepID=UPI003CEC6099
MDTKPLERFATWARRELINAVDAQATAVLAIGSVARSERAEVIKKLEKEIASHGRQQVVDKVAYIWFNRIIALRFMDARGYTDAAVVSPAQGQAHGQPEILSDAKRGNLDTDVVTKRRTANAIIGLLDGTRRSTDAEGEAYALLLTEYCRYWHKSMPFMFEREGDYTELLVPANLLADGAILARAREVLKEDVCDDVEVIGWLYQFYISERKDEVFAGFKKNKKAGSDEIPAATQLFTPHWIVRYLVENSLGRLWMLNRPASSLIDKMHYYIAPVDEGTEFLKINGPEELTLIDPACGSGHMLTYAFDLLSAIYAEEGYGPSEIPTLILTHNLHGAEIDPRARALAAFALTMKARAQDRRFFSKEVEPKICMIEPISFEPDELDILATSGGDRDTEEAFWNQFRDADTLGSLIQPDASATKQSAAVLTGLQDHEETLYADMLARARNVIAQAAALSRRYSVVTANPPYMGSKNMDARLIRFAKDLYPTTKLDLMTMFMERASTLTVSGGYWAIINLPAWLAATSYTKLRTWLLSDQTIDSLVQFGRGVFGSDFGSVGFVVRNARPSGEERGTYRKLFDNHVDVRSVETIESLFLDRGYSRYERRQSDLRGLPGAPIAFWLSDAMLMAFSRGSSLAEFVPTREGLTTGDNDRFLRRWYEVGSSAAGGWATDSVATDRRWFPYLKGGEYRLWWGNHEYVVDWEHDGARQRQNVDPATGRVRSHNYNGEFAFLPGFTWTGLSSGGFSGRLVPEGFMFDAKAPMAYAAGRAQIEALLSILNSSTGAEFLKVLAPALDFKLGTVMSTPAPGRTSESLLLDGPRIAELVSVSRKDWDDFETSWGFGAPSWLVSSGAGASVKLTELLPRWSARRASVAREQAEREVENNRIVAESYGLSEEVAVDLPLHRVSLTRNVEFRYGRGKTAFEYAALERADVASELVSYAVGCMFGRYSLDEPGLILADQGETLQDYLAKVSLPTFVPDADNVIPFVDDGWFEDDIVECFRQFLRAAFGAEHFEENLRFVEDSLGVKMLRDYFITRAGRSKFYDDHVQRYKKRPIYWMFSSPRGSFNALIYMHRYTPSTVSTVLNEYLREYRAKLEVALANAERAAVGSASAKEQKEVDRLRKVLVELAEYEHDVLYPLATQQIVIDLDDGVKANYPKFYPALKNIAGLEGTE